MFAFVKNANNFRYCDQDPTETPVSSLCPNLDKPFHISTSRFILIPHSPLRAKGFLFSGKLTFVCILILVSILSLTFRNVKYIIKKS